MVLNFDKHGKYMYRINTGMSQQICDGEETFARIFYDVERFSVPLYRAMVLAIVAFDKGNTSVCANHVASIASQLKNVLGAYLDRTHHHVIAHSVWLPHVQGFYAGGIGHYNEETQEWEKYDGLSGNQVLLFQALDAFLGIDQYLSQLDQNRSVPRRQRDLCHVLRKYSFRGRLSELPGDDDEAATIRSMDDITKKLKVCDAISPGNDTIETNEKAAVPRCAQSSCKDVPVATRPGEGPDDGWQVRTERRLGRKLGISG
jgi:hypothetical protein